MAVATTWSSLTTRTEIAQSEAATGKPYAKSWLHCGMITINGEKMSKSLGNFFTIREVLEKYHPKWCVTC